ncbi:MAG: hypothetical protein GY804_00085 [Alphaproteobacteria bacterium]|nr:hypothetical protein [Alphaproteobacteria bacterium]
MHIISKFKDYYDIGLSEGHDKTIVYKRFTEEETHQISRFRPKNTKPVRFEKETTVMMHSLGFDYQWIVVGFCGKIFQCLKLERGFVIHDGKKNVNKIKTFCCYKPEHVTKVFRTHATKEELKSFLSKPRSVWRESLRLSSVQNRFYNWNNDRHSDVFIKMNTPIFVVDRVETKFRHDLIRIRSNVMLDYYQFYQVFCPYTTFQEISMFISGVLGMGEPDMIEISDECKRDSKGFNEKSFKTRPNTKPNRKRDKHGS